MSRAQATAHYQTARGLLEQARQMDEQHRGRETWNAEVERQIDDLLGQAEVERTLGQAIESGEMRSVRISGLAEFLESGERLPGMGSGGGEQRERRPGGGPPESLQHRAFRAYLRGGPAGVEELGPEAVRALSVGTDAEGGYLVPDVFRGELIRAISDLVWMRELGRVLPALPAGAALNAPAQDSDLSAAAWTTEVPASITMDTVQPFGGRTLTPHPLVKGVKVSNTLMRSRSFDVEAWVRDQFAMLFGEAGENGYLTGTGAQQPLGVFNSASRGTDYTVASATDLVTDDLIGAEFTLKAQYRRRARWLFHRTIIKELSLLKDGNGQYIWRPGMIAGQPSMLRNYPVAESEFAPSSSATGLYVGALADWRSFWIVDSQQLTVQRLVELYAGTRQVGFIGTMETDGMVVEGSGVVRIKMA